jgi:hypothetical protein
MTGAGTGGLTCAASSSAPPSCLGRLGAADWQDAIDLSRMLSIGSQRGIPASMSH